MLSQNCYNLVIMDVILDYFLHYKFGNIIKILINFEFLVTECRLE